MNVKRFFVNLGRVFATNRQGIETYGKTGRMSALWVAMIMCACLPDVSGAAPPPGRTLQEVLPRGPRNTVRRDPTSIPQPKSDVVKPPVDPTKRPKLRVDDVAHDFGEMWIGPTLEHTFTIWNDGATVLHIERVKPSCGCTVAGPYPKEINPGESGQFSFKLVTTKLRGKFEKLVTISTDDPANSSLRLRLRGHIKHYVELTPATANFGKIFGTVSEERVVRITNNTDEPLELKLAKQDLGDGLSVTLVETAEGKAFELRVKADAPLKTGMIRKMVELTTNKEGQRKLKVSVRGDVPRRLEVSPTVLTYSVPRRSQGRPARGITRILRFTNYGEANVKLVDVTADDPSLSVQFKEQREGRAYTVQVEFPSDYKIPAGGTKITLKTDDETLPVLEVPVRSRATRSETVKRPRRPAEQLVGEKVLAFAAVTADSKPFKTEDLKGKVTVIDFFAANCGFCKKQIPRLEKVRSSYEGVEDVRFVAVSQTMRGKKYTDQQITDIVNKLGWKGELVFDPPNTIGSIFQASSYPTMVVIGKTAKIEAVNVGNLGDLEMRLRGQIDALKKGRPVPKFAATVKGQKPSRKRPAQLVGKPAPQFSFETLDGKKISNAELAKSPATILNFVATNCGYCKKQIPRLEKIRAKYESQGVRFVNVVETMRKEYTADEVKDIMKQAGSHLELAHDPKNLVGPLFSASGFPTMVLLGRSGKVEAVNVGNVADLETRLPKQLDAVIAGKPIPTIAAATPPKRQKRKRPEEMIGQAAPKFTFQTLDGKTFSNAGVAQASATVLNIVATNCGYCKKQIPRVDKVRAKYEAQGVRFVNVVQTMRKKFTTDEVVDVMKGIGSHMELAHDPDNKVGPLFNASGFPTMIVLGKSGKIEAVNVGNVSDLESRLGKQLDAVIAGKPMPKTAAAAPAKRPTRKRPQELIGKPAPKFTFQTLDGKTISNADVAKASATVLNIVATNCGYCKKQIPRIEKFREKYEAKGVRFVNVVQTMRKKFTADEVTNVMKSIGSHMELAHDPDNKVGPLFNATGFPTMIVLGKSGKIEAVNVGNIGDLETRLPTQLDAVIAGKPIPKSASAQPKAPTRKRPDELVGKPAPRFTFQTLDGKTISNAGVAQSSATVLNIVATNCGYCKKQIPRVEKIRKKYEAQGVRFVNVVQTMRKKFTADEVLSVMKGIGSNLELAHDPSNKVGPLFNATGFPTMIVLGKSGKIEAVNVGNVADLETRLPAQLDAVIAGKPIPKSAAAAAPKKRKRPALAMVGKAAPNFALTTIKGQKVNNFTFPDYSATVLNFVAPNCGFCKRQLPNLETVRKEYETKGVRFVNVIQKMRKDFTQEEILGVISGTGSNLEVSTSDFGANTVGRKFKATSYPTMMVVARNGIIANVNIGAKKDLVAILKGQLDSLIK